MTSQNRSSGFTLIELMITISIVAILATLANASYSQYVRRANRAEAKSILLNIQVEQEKAFLQYKRYAKNDTELAGTATATTPGLKIPTTSSSGNYTISLASTDSGVSDYTATATVTSAHGQNKDTDCKVFQVDNLGNKTSESSSGGATTSCWSR